MIFIPFAFPGVPGVGCVFGTGLSVPGGLADPRATMAMTGAADTGLVAANRRAAKAALGFAVWHSLKQVHGVELAFEPAGDNMTCPSNLEADGMVDSRPGHALAIKTADCQPVLLAHSSGRFVAALHVGWRGSVANFIGVGVRGFCAQYGLSPADLLAVRGPSLGPGAAEFQRFATEFGDSFRPFFDPRTQRVDLWRLTRAQLLSAGLREDCIFGLDLCTHDLPQFFSYRRDRTTGRQTSLIWIRENA